MPRVDSVEEAVVGEDGAFLLAGQRAAGRPAAEREDVLDLEIGDVVGRDLSERGMPPVAVVLMVAKPVLGLRIEKTLEGNVIGRGWQRYTSHARRRERGDGS